MRRPLFTQKPANQNRRYRLALRELEACACALLAVLLALLDASVARHQAISLERLAKLQVEEHQRACNSELDRIRLGADTAAADRGHNVKIRRGLGEREGTQSRNPLLFRHEINFERLVVDGEPASAGTQKHASDRRFAPSCAVVLNQICHVRPMYPACVRLAANESLYNVWNRRLLLRQRRKLQHLRLLRRVRMSVALVDLQLGSHLAAHLRLWQHALYGIFHNLFRTPCEQASK